MLPPASLLSQFRFCTDAEAPLEPLRTRRGRRGSYFISSRPFWCSIAPVRCSFCGRNVVLEFGGGVFLRGLLDATLKMLDLVIVLV